MEGSKQHFVEKKGKYTRIVEMHLDVGDLEWKTEYQWCCIGNDERKFPTSHRAATHTAAYAKVDVQHPQHRLRNPILELK